MKTLAVLFAFATLCAGCIKACGDVHLDSDAVAVGLLMGAAASMAGRR